MSANTAHIARERYIVRALIRHLGARGWSPYVNDDGGEHVYCPDEARAMDTVFSVDESRLHFAPAALVAEVEETFDPLYLREWAHNARRQARKACDNACHAVLLICGNDMDIISDWSYREPDDGFSAAMNAFPDTEELCADMPAQVEAPKGGAS